MKPKSPGQDDLYDRIARLERTIAELTRGTKQGEVCKVYLRQSVNVGPGDTRLNSQFSLVPDTGSSSNIYYTPPSNVSDNNPQRFILPHAGRWRLTFQAVWDKGSYSWSSSNGPRTVGALIQSFNQSTGARTNLANDARILSPFAAETICVARCDHLTFNATAQITFQVYASGTTRLAPSMSGYLFSYVMAEYVGQV